MPYRAELAVAAVVIVLVATLDVRGAIGFSSFGVLTYYALTNASALRLGPDEGRPPRWVSVLGLVGCVVLAVTLPLPSILGGLAVALRGRDSTLGRPAAARSRSATRHGRTTTRRLSTRERRSPMTSDTTWTDPREQIEAVVMMATVAWRPGRSPTAPPPRPGRSRSWATRCWNATSSAPATADSRRASRSRARRSA